MAIQQILEHERIWVAGLNHGDVSVADDVFAPDCVIHITGVPDPFRGVGEWKRFLSAMLAAFPDLHFTIEDQLVAGDRAAFRWHATGSHTGPLGEVPPTGKQVALDGLILDHLTEGRVTERWEQWDQPMMLQQLGLA